MQCFLNFCPEYVIKTHLGQSDIHCSDHFCLQTEVSSACLLSGQFWKQGTCKVTATTLNDEVELWKIVPCGCCQKKLISDNCDQRNDTDWGYRWSIKQRQYLIEDIDDQSRKTMFCPDKFTFLGFLMKLCSPKCRPLPGFAQSGIANAGGLQPLITWVHLSTRWPHLEYSCALILNTPCLST